MYFLTKNLKLLKFNNYFLIFYVIILLFSSFLLNENQKNIIKRNKKSTKTKRNYNKKVILRGGDKDKDNLNPNIISMIECKPNDHGCDDENVKEYFESLDEDKKTKLGEYIKTHSSEIEGNILQIIKKVLQDAVLEKIDEKLLNLLTVTDYPKDTSIKQQLLQFINNITDEQIEAILDAQEYILSDFFISLLCGMLGNQEKDNQGKIKYTGKKQTDFILSASDSIRPASDVTQNTSSPKKTVTRSAKQYDLEMKFRNIIIKNILAILTMIKNDDPAYQYTNLSNLAPKKELQSKLQSNLHNYGKIIMNGVDIYLIKQKIKLNQENTDEITGWISSFFSTNNLTNNNNKSGRLTKFTKDNGDISDSEKYELIYKYLLKNMSNSSTA